MQRKIFLTVGIPSSGKSTWAKEEVAKDPLNTLRLNNDDLRATFNGSVWSSEYEKIIEATRNFLIEKGLKAGKDIIIDNLNLAPKHFSQTCEIVKKCNVDAMVIEKHFYISLEEALERNSKRTGTARLDDKVIEKWWKTSGKEMFKHYKPKVEVFSKQNHSSSWTPLKQDFIGLDAVIVDIDGTLAKIGDRSPFDASRCDEVDLPNEPVVEMVNLYYRGDFRIIFCSGRMEKDEAPTKRFIARCIPGLEYELFMRKNGDLRPDDIIKEEIFREKIEGRYIIKAVIDDRAKVCRMWHRIGLNLFRVGDPDAEF
jgi:predicted kinase